MDGKVYVFLADSIAVLTVAPGGLYRERGSLHECGAIHDAPESTAVWRSYHGRQDSEGKLCFGTKKLGRQVAGFDQTLWEAECQRIVYEGNWAKFTQNEELLTALRATRGTTLVEASPDDRIWGVGLAEEDPRIRNRRTWRGTNWLGEILTRLREDIGSDSDE